RISFLLALVIPLGAQENPTTARTKADSPSSGMVSSSDRKFIEDAAKGGAAEVALGQLAVQRASDPKVKIFGQRMIDDHTKVNQDLEKLASRKGITIAAHPAIPPTKLANLTGTQFDDAYVQMMIEDHQKDVAEFEKQSRNAHDPEVKEFATSNLPTLKDHLKE